MQTYNNLYTSLCSYDNLKLAFTKARKRKTQKLYIIEFESELEWNLTKLKYELETFTYKPAKLTVFIIRDPKTRKISASSFRDRVVHHALCNIIAPIFEKSFIYDSFANQKGKGTHKAIARFERFMKKIAYEKGSRNLVGGWQRKLSADTHNIGHVLKADVRHYFDTVDHEILIQIVRRKIKDEKVIWLLKTILNNHETETLGKGMPIGNLTSQFLANVYLNELDYFVKHKLKAKYYIRYVDDFVIFHKDKALLEKWEVEIDNFLKNALKVELHPEKTRTVLLGRGVTFLGLRIFYHHKLIKKSNRRRIWKRIRVLKEIYYEGKLSRDDVESKIQGWLAYAEFANTYKLRNKVLGKVSDIFT